MGNISIKSDGTKTIETFEELSERIEKETENWTKFGKWKIESDGDLVYDNWYRIPKNRLQEKGWIAHINTKKWSNNSMQDFISAYFQALKNNNVKELKITIY